MKLRQVLYGILAGGLLTAPLIGVMALGDQLLGLPFPPYDLFNWISRLLPGTLGNPESSRTESFEGGVLEGPQYTRPAEFRGREVPEVLRSGDHAAIARWRHERALEITKRRRPDLAAPGGEEER